MFAVPATSNEPKVSTKQDTKKLEPVTMEDGKPCIIALDRPKRPLSAYNLFFQEERRKLLAERPVRPQGIPVRRGGGHGKVGFGELAKTVAAKWKVIDASTKKEFDRLAQQEKLRYQQKLVEWKQQYSNGHTKKRKMNKKDRTNKKQTKAKAVREEAPPQVIITNQASSAKKEEQDPVGPLPFSSSGTDNSLSLPNGCSEDVTKKTTLKSSTGKILPQIPEATKLLMTPGSTPQAMTQSNSAVKDLDGPHAITPDTMEMVDSGTNIVTLQKPKTHAPIGPVLLSDCSDHSSKSLVRSVGTKGTSSLSTASHSASSSSLSTASSLKSSSSSLRFPCLAAQVEDTSKSSSSPYPVETNRAAPSSSSKSFLGSSSSSDMHILGHESSPQGNVPPYTNNDEDPSNTLQVFPPSICFPFSSMMDPLQEPHEGQAMASFENSNSTLIGHPPSGPSGTALNGIGPRFSLAMRPQPRHATLFSSSSAMELADTTFHAPTITSTCTGGDSALALGESNQVFPEQDQQQPLPISLLKSTSSLSNQTCEALHEDPLLYPSSCSSQSAWSSSSGALSIANSPLETLKQHLGDESLNLFVNLFTTPTTTPSSSPSS